MSEILTRFTDEQLLAMHRVFKTRLRAFFAHPRDAIALRAEIKRRGLT
jgi:hypothetical protein